MITVLIDRLTGFLRQATRPASADSAPYHIGDAADMVRPFPSRTPLISPITIGLLEALGIRHALAVQWLPHLSQAAHRYQIDTSPRRVAAWLATIAHESARLTRVVENLNYSAEGLAQTWPARYADMTGAPNSLAQTIARKSATIASITYADRMGNGPRETADGWRYRGRGLIQITGRANYARTGAALGLDLVLNPELLEQPFLAAQSAAWWWADAGCNELADHDAMDDITRKVNGGLTGFTDRLKLYDIALAYLGSA